MSNKLIDLDALSAYKTSSDAKYQDKLTAGGGIALSNNVISVAPTIGEELSSSVSVTNNTVFEIGSVTLAPGYYMMAFTCYFDTNATGYRQCGFSTNNTNLMGLGRAWCDSKVAVSGESTQTLVTGPITVSATTYPNGRTFYFLAKQTSGGSLTAYPKFNYIKF